MIRPGKIIKASNENDIRPPRRRYTVKPEARREFYTRLDISNFEKLNKRASETGLSINHIINEMIRDMK